MGLLDFRLEQWINGPAGSQPFWDPLMKAAAAWGEPVFVAVVALWILAGLVRRRRHELVAAISALLASGGALLVNQVVGHLWVRPRPFAVHPGVHVLLSHSRDASFPSDHAAAGFAIAVVLTAYHRRLGVLALLFAALMSYARVYVGDHYPGDVLGGAVIGLVAGLVALRVVPALAARVSPSRLERPA